MGLARFIGLNYASVTRKYAVFWQPGEHILFGIAETRLELWGGCWIVREPRRSSFRGAGLWWHQSCVMQDFIGAARWPPSNLTPAVTPRELHDPSMTNRSWPLLLLLCRLAYIYVSLSLKHYLFLFQSHPFSDVALLDLTLQSVKGKENVKNFKKSETDVLYSLKKNKQSKQTHLSPLALGWAGWGCCLGSVGGIRFSAFGHKWTWLQSQHTCSSGVINILFAGPTVRPHALADTVLPLASDFFPWEY